MFKLRKTMNLAMGSLIAVGVMACQTNNWPQPENQMQEANLFSSEQSPPERIRGVWKSHGYGWALEITETSARLFDIDENFCISAESAMDTFPSYFHYYSLENNDARLGLRGFFEPYTYYFEKMDKLPEQCSQQTPDTAQSNFDVLVSAMNTHYAFFGVREVDWNAIVTAHASQISSSTKDDELWAIFKSMLQTIDDGHLTLTRVTDAGVKRIAPGRGRTMLSVVPLAQEKEVNPGRLFGDWYDDYTDKIETEILQSAGHSKANGKVIYGITGENIGYINILGMGGYVPDLGWSIADLQIELDVLNAALDDAMELFKNTDGVIVDVTNNSGGLDYLGRDIAARFADKRRRGNYRYPANLEGIPEQDMDFEPNSYLGYDGPVIVLSSNLTVSAGESFLMFMRELPQVTHMGEPTRGALSEVLTKTLPNGWELSLSNEHYLDAKGISWEGKGIPPEIPLQIFDEENIFEGHVEAVAAVAEILRNKP